MTSRYRHVLLPRVYYGNQKSSFFKCPEKHTSSIVKVYFKNGLHVIVDGLHMLFDPASMFINDQVNGEVIDIPVDIVFLSHAHADHCNAYLDHSGKGIPCILHPATMEIVSRKSIVDVPVLVKNGSKVTVKGIDVESFDAGHCLGSLQFRVTTSGGRFVYTGDFNLDESMTMKPAAIIPGEYLAMETTLGDPAMVQEYREAMYMEMQDIVLSAFDRNEKLVVIYGYPLGTAQEMVALFNSTDRKQFNIFADNVPYYMTTLYAKHFGTLGECSPWNWRNGSGKRLLVADFSRVKYSNTIGKTSGKEPTSILIARRKFEGFNCFNLSFHSDFRGLERYVRESGATTVFPFHGEHAVFAREMVSRGVRVIDPHATVHDG